jgi:hypothetical protein
MSSLESAYNNPSQFRLPQTQFELSPRLKKIVQAYQEANLPYFKAPDDDRDVRFNHIAKKRPDTVKKYVVWVFRVKAAPTSNKKSKETPPKEYLVYYQHQTALAHNDDEVSYSGNVGVWSKPLSKLAKTADGEPERYKPAGNEWVYEIPFSKEKLKEIIDSSETEVTQFYLCHAAKSGDNWIGNNNKQYSIHNVDDFINGSFDELWQMSEFGYSTNESCLSSWRENQEKIKENLRQAKLQQKTTLKPNS